MIHRPLPEGYEKVNYKKHFELRYLRWDYLVKVANPTNDQLTKREAIVKYCAHMAFKKYIYEFTFQGLRLEDIENIARIYTASYIGLYSSENNFKVKQKHASKLKESLGKEPELADMAKKDNNTLISFLNQRFMECAYLFRKKSEKDVGFSHYAIYVQNDKDQWPEDEELVGDPQKHGWEKVPWSKFVKIKDMFAMIVPGYSVEIEGKIYRVANAGSSLIYSSPDMGDIYENVFSSPLNPEEQMIKNEEENIRPMIMNGKKTFFSKLDRLNNLIELFKKRPARRQERILNLLISWLEKRNGSQNEMQFEIEQARMLLGSVRKKLTRTKNEGNKRHSPSVD